MGKYNSLAELFAATANAIRTKTEGTEPIVAEDFPEAIEGIQAGGGSILPFSGGATKFSSGTFMFTNWTETNYNITVEHDLGYVPTGGMFVMTSNASSGISQRSIWMYFSENDGLYLGAFTNGSTGMGATRGSATATTGMGDVYLMNGVYNATDKTVALGVTGPNLGGSSVSYAFNPECTYAWIVWIE